MSNHARIRAEELGFSEAEVLEAAANPEVIYPGGRNYGEGDEIRQRGDVAIAVSSDGTIKTVLLRTGAQWRHGVDKRTRVG